jgi:hypothetical protein
MTNRLDFDHTIRFADREQHYQRRTPEPKDSFAHRFANSERVACQLGINLIRRLATEAASAALSHILISSSSASGIHTTVNRLIRLLA